MPLQMRRKNKRNRIILIILLVLLLLLIVALSIYFFSGLFTKKPKSPSTSDLPKKISSNMFLANTADGRIISFDPGDDRLETLYESGNTNIVTAFDYYRNQTIYYGMGDHDEPVHSLSKDFGDLVDTSAQWTKTALAVDYLSEKVYVIDGNVGKIYVADMLGKHAAAVLSDLNEPRDIVLDARRHVMFVLQKSSILKVNMDGSEPEEIKDIKRKRKIKAITVDPDNTMLYFATTCAIKSVNYSEPSIKPVTGIIIDDDITSLAVVKNQIFFVGVPKNSKDKVLTSCVMDDRICKKVNRYSLHANVESIKAFRNSHSESEVRNPCAGGNCGCEHLCILTPKSDGCTCVCDEGWKLKNDLRTCSQDM